MKSDVGKDKVRVEEVKEKIMGRAMKVEPHLTLEELEERYRKSSDGIERSHWQIIWLLKQGKRSVEVAELTGYSQIWVQILARRYNEQGPEGWKNRKKNNPGAKPLLSEEQQWELKAALEQRLAPDGGLWSGPKVAMWISEKLNRPVQPQLGWDYLKRLGFRLRVPRPRHVKADVQAQEAFKKGG